MAKFRRNSDLKTEENTLYSDINLDALEQEFQLDQDADLVCDFVECDEIECFNEPEDVCPENQPIKNTYVENNRANIEYQPEKVEKKVVEKTKKVEKEEVKTVENLKQKLRLINEINSQTMRKVESELCEHAMCENATSATLIIPKSSHPFIEKWLKEQELQVTSNLKQEDVEICVAWS